MRKKTAAFVCLCCALLVFTGCALAASGTEIAVLRIGKADAIIISTEETVILIDAGEEDDGAEILSYFARKGIQRIDVMIITHYDKDHVGGAAEVLMGIPVGAIYDAAYETDTKHYDRYLKAIGHRDVPRTRVRAETALTLGSLSLTLIPSPVQTDEDNDRSLTISMADPWYTYFFAADAEEALIDALLARGLSQHDLVKMPHHGQTKDNLEAFLAALSPTVAIITDSDKNSADDETLALLAEMGIATYETRHGDIRIVAGEKRFEVGQ